jgi:serine O-acetyltransferase
MKYIYDGNAINRLLQSYQRDKEPFIKDTTIRFVKRSHGFKEIGMLKELFFPYYWNRGIITKNRKELKKSINELARILVRGVRPYLSCREDINRTITKVLESLPNIRESLKKDIEAAYKGDPAARSYTEIIRSYPGFNAILVQRVAHILYELKIPSYPRELTEQIHSTTGIDIHPGAKIGEYFFIDHGNGVVIGETTEIGNHVRIYQGVTLGVLHFKKHGNGLLKKGYKRHPTIGNHVVIGAGTKILGPVNVGDHVNVGANSWIEEDIPSHTTVFILEHPKLMKKEKYQ